MPTLDEQLMNLQGRLIDAAETQTDHEALANMLEVLLSLIKIMREGLAER